MGNTKLEREINTEVALFTRCQTAFTYFFREFLDMISHKRRYLKVSPHSQVHKETPAAAQPRLLAELFPFLSGTQVTQCYLPEWKGRGSNSFLLGMPSKE